jgi:rhodanese-related sulfurtransferase
MTYAGDVSPTEAYRALAEEPEAVLVDVRTRAELVYVGHPDLSGIGKRLAAVEWPTGPGASGSDFVDQLDRLGVDRGAQVFFICRSGSRSRFAAMAATAAGYERAHNVAHGFEGPPDAHGHRGSSAGWKVDGLPWRQT